MHTIAIAGFQHETNSFGVGHAGLAEFEMADSWPGYLRGPEVTNGTRGLNLPIAGAIAAAAPDLDIQPISWCAAEPSGPVTDEAFDTITGDILDAMSKLDRLDGIYLDLHGAMVTDSHDDGEGEFLTRLRRRFGPDMPVAVSLDMHANVTSTMVDCSDAITVYRTYPHLDMAETGARAIQALEQIITGHRPAKAFQQIPYIIPMHAQFTGDGAMKELYDEAQRLSAQDIRVELAAGFSASDIPDTGPSVIVYAPTQKAADETADQFLETALRLEAKFDCALPPAKDAVRRAMRYPPGKPVTIADVQDNPGGGASSDTTGLLRALVSEGAKGAILGVMHDPGAAQLAHKNGLESTMQLELGGKSGQSSDAPFSGRFRVEALSAGRVTYEGDMYGGGIAEIGPSALLRLLDHDADVQIVVSTIRNQCLDCGYFRHLGIHPEAAQIIVVKSTVHYRADFEQISQAVLSAEAPGALICDISAVPYQKLRKNVRLGPLGPAFGTA